MAARAGLTLLIMTGLLAILMIGRGLMAIPAYADFAQAHPFHVRGSVLAALECAAALALVATMSRSGAFGAAGRLGLTRNPVPAAVFAALAVIPLYAVFALVMPAAEEMNPPRVLYLALISPIAEEVVFRGYAFGELRRRARLPFWLAALLPALVFGAIHLSGGADPADSLGVFAITAIGSVFFSWLHERWGFNLWAPIFVHSLMNLAWNVFTAGESAFAGWLPTTMQIVTLVSAILLTELFRRRRG